MDFRKNMLKGLLAIIAVVAISNVAYADDNSAYTLTRVETQGENTITKYEYNNETKQYEPAYYEVTLNKTEYGHLNATNSGGVKYYEWTKDANNNYTLTENSSSTNADIKYFVDADRISGRISSNLNGANLDNDFIGNTSYNDGGAIFNYKSSTMGDITGDFVGNTSFVGSAIYNSGIISDITGNFIGNSGSSYVIFNSGTIGDITGNFIGNSGSVIECQGNNGTIANITGTFIGNVSEGGTISAYTGTIGNIDGIFIGNRGGAINVYSSGDIGNIKGTFIGNSSSNIGGAIYHSPSWNGHAENITGNFIGNTAKLGGAIYNGSTITNGIVNSSFYNNSAISSDSTTAQGGAICTYTNLSFIAKDNYTSVFQGNYTEQNGVRDDNAIWSSSYNYINFKMQNGGKFYFADNIDGNEGYGVNIQGDDIDNTTFYMLNDIRNANVAFDTTTINTVNNAVHEYNFNKFSLNNDTKFVADVDLANATMDRITAGSYGSHNGNLIVSGMNLISDALPDTPITEIFFAEAGLKDHVVNGMQELPDRYQTSFYTPIYKYNAVYENRDDGGYFLFTQGDKIITSGGGTISTGNPSDAFNPSVIATPAAAQGAATSTMSQTINYAFQNADNFMNIPYLERLAIKNANRYAISPTGTATDVGRYSPLYDPNKEYKSAWFKPYVSFESIPLKNGPKVSNISYGSLIGFDSEMKELRRGWDRVWTGYVGYNGASQTFSGVDSSQNGGLLGGTLTMYKGNFFNATTVSTGAMVGENHTMYGHENYTMLLAGIANKMGYNVEFKNGRFIVQPSVLVGYTFVNTFDYTNAAGVRIKSDPLHAIQVAPGVKFISNTKRGWQPYLGVSMVWNILDKSSVTANDVKLPEMSVKPYIQYGLGIQKRFKDNYMMFGQAMIQNGGRNGIALSFGMRWAIGKDKPIDRVQKDGDKVAVKKYIELR